MKDKESILQVCLNFFDEIGIRWQFDSFAEESFLPGVKIKSGGLIIDKERLLYPGDLLHEAGHIAIHPQDLRESLDDNVRECGQGDGEEIAAIAWSWAALTYLNIAPEVVFHEKGYKGSAQSLITCFENKNLFGQSLLSYYNMCDYDHNDLSIGFPEMTRWLRA